MFKEDNKIRRRYATIQRHLKKWNDELKKLQDQCDHTVTIKDYKSNTGNYDPSENSYWIKHTCAVCRKTWREDQ